MELETIWNSISPFQSSINAQTYLNSCYLKQNLEDAEKRSFDNCYPFMYYLEHGKNYYELAMKSPLSIQPILLFYGMVQFLKASLLTVDPEYPESTTVLAHGVSARKRKKQNYEFLKDEVKIQKNGLFPHFSKKLFNIDQLEGEKFSMNDLLKRIPELNDLYYFSFKKNNFYKIKIKDNDQIYIPNKIIDDLKMTHTRFIDFFKNTFPSEEVQSSNTNSNKEFTFICKGQLSINNCNPIGFNFYTKTFYIPVERDMFSYFPEIMIHYLLLYNLSMICRYETEWWSELLYTFDSVDYPFIQQFINLTKVKIPYLLLSFLTKDYKGNYNYNS